MTTKPQVFISYSQKDRPYLDRIRSHLRSFELNTDIKIWDDQKLTAGDRWEEKIHGAIETATVAILLISPDFLASAYINKIELPKLLEKAERNELRILPIIVRPAPWVHTPLAYYQVLPRDGQSLSELSVVEQDKALQEISNVLASVVYQAKNDPKKKPNVGESDTALSDVTNDSLHKIKRNKDGVFFISHAKEDGDFAENLKWRMASKGFEGWIDVDVLEAGMDWRHEIDDAIVDSYAVILILSPDSKVSEYVTYEWAFGLGCGLRVLPLLLRDTPIHPRLEAFQYLDFTNRRARPWTKLFDLLEELVDNLSGD